MRKLKRVVIKEELVALTGDHFKALVLNQFLYWSERVSDIDDFIHEENNRREFTHDNPIDLQKGWIYKKLSTLAAELMINISPKTLTKHIRELIERGFIFARTNPKYKWDKTLQYRVNFLQIIHDLNLIGYPLEGYKTLAAIESVILPIRESNFTDSNTEITPEKPGLKNKPAQQDDLNLEPDDVFSIDAPLPAGIYDTEQARLQAFQSQSKQTIIDDMEAYRISIEQIAEKTLPAAKAGR